MDNQKVSVRYAKQINFKNNDGSLIQGTQIFFEPIGNGVNNNDEKGIKPGKAFLDFDYWNNLVGLTLPFDAELHYEINFSTGKLKITGFKPIQKAG